MVAVVLWGEPPKEDNFYGVGYGVGYGSGYIDGSGYAYIDGYFSGSEEYWLSCILYLAQKWGTAQKERLAELMNSPGVVIAYWRSDNHGMPANGGGWIKPAAPGVVHTVSGPLSLCVPGTLHATLFPQKWRGERWWIVALHGEIIGDGEKYGCLKREIIGEAI